MAASLQTTDWKCLLDCNTDAFVDALYRVLKKLIDDYVPSSVEVRTRSTLPWLNDKCMEVIQIKHVAEGQQDYNVKAEHCKAVLHEAHMAYRVRMKERMAKFARNSKQWWTIAQQLLHKNASTSFFPPINQ